MEHVWTERVAHFTRKQTAAALTACVTLMPACHAAPRALPEQQAPSVSEGAPGVLADSPRASSGRESSSAPKCVAASDLTAPPHKVYDRKADLSDLRAVRTHAGVLVFDVTIGPSGTVADVQLGKPVDAQEPWPTLAERWRAAIRDWRYEPSTQNDRPVSVCVTVTVTIHVR